MSRVTETLFSFFEDGSLPGAPALFVNARAHPLLEQGVFTLQQGFKPWVRELAAAGLQSSPEIPPGPYTAAFVLLPKNADEARYDVARALAALKDGGMLVCAGANDAGGKRAQKMLEDFGLDRMRQVSGNKAKAAGGWKNGMSDEAKKALEEGAPRLVEETDFVSQPGLFAWDRADKGSEILAREIPEDLSGAGADLGCGYGFLSRLVLQHCKTVKSLTCVDADYRAVEACKKNMNGMKPSVKYLWEDLTQEIPGLRGLDFVVMNPPFHEGKKSNAEIGKAFVRRAAEALKSGGEMWMVANVHLPYEKDIGACFSKSEKFFEGGGYKILRAVK